jgi:hypothetical protein
VTFTELTILAAMVVIGVMFANTAVTLVAVADMPKPPPRKSLTWVHFGLSEPSRWDDSIFGRPLDEIYGRVWVGETTGVWPMVMELKDEPYEAAAEVPAEETVLTGPFEVVEEPAPENFFDEHDMVAIAMHEVPELPEPTARERFATKPPAKPRAKRGPKVTVTVGEEVRSVEMAEVTS